MTNIKRAVEVLKSHNEWRSNPQPTSKLEMQNSRDITNAINIAIEVLEEALEHVNNDE